ncbi:MAG: Transcriptional regulator [Candidatus Daviesbacteria bacterium GW2011_GWA1_41_61]|nr:MAG: Transcriptional regulator [Candidatus Daviesbacteria bacterium GW2011_GWB1_41_15]KKS15676.1 MAG: Transcriptional regulator [Candidatus Daviesbacteria bacterium GW2011_GWA1_41_61]
MEELFISRVRVKLLTLFLTSQEPLLHVREIVRRVDEEINAVRRELLRMEKFGMVASEWRANRRLYHFRKDYIFYHQLVGMVAKQSGLGGEIIKNRVRLGKIKYAMIATRFFKRQPSGPEDVDLLVVGQIVLPELQSLISNEQAKRDQEINYSFMDEAEFQFRVRRRDPFILRVVTQSKIMLIGDEEDLLLGVLI